MDRWIFGYGSLIWRPDFPHAERQPAAIRGWVRRFWQASPDHRGTPDAPGRVVTLVPREGAVCDGAAYRVSARDWPEVGARLDHRERAGYRRHEVEIALFDGRRVPGLVYVAGPSNPNFIGPAPLAQMAAHIAARRGPSGTNREYLDRLARSLREMGAHDPHVFALERATGRIR